MDINYYYLKDAVKFKKENEKYIGKISKYTKAELKAIIIFQKTPKEFGQMWAEQNEHFEIPTIDKMISKKDFEKQMTILDGIDLTKIEGCFYEVIGVFYLNYEPHFPPSIGKPHYEPMHLLLSSGFA